MNNLPTPPQRSGQLSRSVGLSALALALIVGIQLGAIPWLYRREFWRLQGLLAGGVIGYVLGRLSRPDRQPHN
jgi:hypothetical protein